MAKRDTLSSIDKLPPEIRELIGKLRRERGATIDEILAHLRQLDVDVSRSALGRHVAKMADIAERMRNSRAIADGLVSQFGDDPDNKLARANLELMHSVVMQIITAAEVDPETGEAQPVTFDPKDAMFLAASMNSLASAEKTNADRIIKARLEAAKAAAKAVDDVARTRPAGLTAETVNEIKRRIMGIAAPAVAPA